MPDDKLPQLAPNSIDPAVKIPDSVRKAAALAESYYAKTPASELPATPIEPPAALAEPPAPAEASAAPAEPPAPPVEPTAAPAELPAPPVPEQQWEHRYNSMKGRYDQSQVQIGSLQEQMHEMGNEIMRLQATLVHNPAPQPTPVTRLITPEDEQAYGPELIDVVKRAAKEVAGPEIEQVKRQNDELRQEVMQQRRTALYDVLAKEVPNWEEINSDQRFLQWLSLRDVYSGGVRKQMLGAAFQAANAPRVVAFFKGFLAEEQATGHVSTVPPHPEPVSQPREPAVPLVTLAAPGRVGPATGGSQVPVEKPIYTRKQISDFYVRVRQGYYAGREADKNAEETSIFVAQREGRVR